MKIARLRAQGFRGLPDHAFSFTRPGSSAPLDVVIVTGEPGSGKTTLLEAIIAAKEDVGAYGTPPPQATYLRDGVPTARLEATWLLSANEAHRAGLNERMVSTTSVFGEGAPPLPEHPTGLRGLFREYSRDATRGKVEYLHAERTLPPGRGVRYRGDLATAADARMRLTTSGEKYRSLRDYLVARVQEGSASLVTTLRERGIALRTTQLDAEHRLRAILRPFLPELEFAGIATEGDGYRVLFQTRGGSVVDLDSLGTSERHALLVALTFERLGLNHSLVLLDGPELHVHARRQADFFALVVALGPDNQTLAATTSHGILSAARPEQIIDLSRLRADVPRR
jgi:energy-coupling factor transporter ATP-binding protein EcfA2